LLHFSALPPYKWNCLLEGNLTFVNFACQSSTCHIFSANTCYLILHSFTRTNGFFAKIEDAEISWCRCSLASRDIIHLYGMYIYYLYIYAWLLTTRCIIKKCSNLYFCLIITQLLIIKVCNYKAIMITHVDVLSLVYLFSISCHMSMHYVIYLLLVAFNWILV